jgi:hypothetical protein
MLSAGLVLAIASIPSAAERARMSEGSGAIRAEETDLVRPVAAELAADAATVDFNGQRWMIRADGSVHLEEVLKHFGSVERFTFVTSNLNVPVSRDTEGKLVYANGAVALLPETLSNSDPIKQALWTTEEAKKHVQWAEREINGQSVLAFANGMVFADSISNRPIDHTVPWALGPDGKRVYADGSVGLSDPATMSRGN